MGWIFKEILFRPLNDIYYEIKIYKIVENRVDGHGDEAYFYTKVNVVKDSG